MARQRKFEEMEVSDTNSVFPLLFSVPVAAGLVQASPPAAPVSPRLSSSVPDPFAAEACFLSLP